MELSDEEFEVHGPRLTRYSNGWAWYLGHHWSYRREQGDYHVTFNYAKAFADYINNFVFGQGLSFDTPKSTAAVIPPLLDRVWNVDNDKDTVLWEMGQQGGVTGDCFVKVAYEEPFVDRAGRPHSGKVRIIPLNSSHCFPEFHPHDRERLTRFKLKYRFWGVTEDGTRAINTYTELLTDEAIEEWVNDRLISKRDNPLGVIPIVMIPNIAISGSPWGLSDINDVIPLNREYNEKATDISDIINYHAAPVTIITGAKASNLEKGAKKVWSLPDTGSKVYNLELGGNLAAPLQYLELLKRSMHEMTGVPETALGQRQPISNTSGVALAIQFQPLMQTWRLKTINYSKGIEKINELVILTLAIKEPQALVANPEKITRLKEGQLPQLDPSDPVTYRTTCNFPPPLPVDVLIKLDEIQRKLGLGLESKRGALRELGYEEPDEKMAEIFEELSLDAKDQAALDMLRVQLEQIVIAATGAAPAEGEEVQSAGEDGGSRDGPRGDEEEGGEAASTLGEDPTQSPVMNQLYAELVTRAYGTKIPQRRTPENP